MCQASVIVSNVKATQAELGAVCNLHNYKTISKFKTIFVQLHASYNCICFGKVLDTGFKTEMWGEKKNSLMDRMRNGGREDGRERYSS